MLKGSIDFIDHVSVSGWVQDDTSPLSAVTLIILVDREVIGEVTANRFRADLKNAEIGDGSHSFEYVFPNSLRTDQEHMIEFRTANGERLPGSPVTLEALRPAATAKGHLDLVDRYRIAGWCQYEDKPDEAVTLIVTVDGKLSGRVSANLYRPDLQAAGIGDGRHAFDWNFVEPLTSLKKHIIRVRRELDGLDILGSPVTLQLPGEFDAKTKADLSDLLASYSREEQIEQKINFLANELSQLLQQKADLDSDRKDRRRNRDLQRRWGRHEPVPAAPIQSDLRALVIDDRFPVLERDAGSVAVVSHMKSLRRLGYAVSFVASSDLSDSAGLEALTSAGFQTYSLPFYGSVEELLWRQAGEFDLIYMHRVSNVAKYGELVRQHFPKARKIFSVADLHHIRLARQANVENRPELAPLVNRLRFMEIFAAASVDAVITHSDYEAALLRKNLPKANIHRVLWSVEPKPTNVPLENRYGIAFIGGFAHAPNIDAAKWIMSSLMPRIRRAVPEIQCYMVGGDFPPELQRLKPDGVTVTGPLADLSSVFDRIRLTLAPLSYGAGIKGKIVDSLAAGIPCVYTGIAGEGMSLPAELNVCRADDDDAISEAVKQLHEDAELNRKCSAAGLSYVRQELSEMTLDRSMKQVVGVERPVMN